MRYGLCIAVLYTVVAAAFAEDANTTPGYPQWRGPEGSGTSIDCGVKLVDSWDKARLMWASEQRNPLPVTWSRSTLNPRRLVGNGGFGAPIYHDGRVYVAAYEPNGPIAETLAARVRSDAPDICKRISADDVLYCLDAQDGTLLWKASFPYGMNMAGHTHSGHYIPSIHNGRAYWVGTIGQLYCVDARTGKKLWHVPLDGGAKQAQQYRRRCLEKKQYPRGGWRAIEDACEEMQPDAVSMRREIGLEGSRGWGWDSPVIAAGEVVVTNTPGRALVAFDARTGERRWYRRNAATATTAPAVWKHKGKAYVIGVGGEGISCTEADTGKQLWGSRLGGSGAYAGYTPPIRGDILVCLGADDEGDTKRGSWAAFRLTLEGPQRLWRLRKPFRCTYESPVIYRGHLWTVLREPRRWTDEQWDWLQEQAPHAFTDKHRKSHNLRNMIAAVNLETGKVSGAVVTGQLGCSSIVGGDGRLIFMGGNSVQMISADPDNPRDLGKIYPGNLYSTTPTYAEGKLFVRGAEYLVNAWNMRATPPKKEAPKREPDPANSRIEIDLQCARIYEEDLRMAFQRGASGETTQAEDLMLHLRTREGKIVQSYVTYGPAHNVPERVYPELALKDGRLSGNVRIESLGRVYPLEMDLEVDGRTLTGIWEDPTCGKDMKGSVSGQASPAATADGKVSLEIRREWCGGCTHSHQTYITFDLKDGKAVATNMDECLGCE
ncbi:MAG: PQQ-binding-like beta-propeller repeat protein, partial [Phycisphaerae bacterium]